MEPSLSPGADGPSSRKDRNIQLDSLPDIDYDDKELDKELFKTLQEYYPLFILSSSRSNPSDYLYVLQEIISSSPALDQSFKDMKKLNVFFQDHEEQLTSLLDEGWNCRSFTHIRKLKDLQPATDKVLSENISKAWEVPYEGSSHAILYDNINEMSRYMAFSTTVTIVQSTGTGKSRMVDEQANLVFTLPFCLRPPTDANSLAYPPSDREVYRYFRNVPSRRQDVVRCHYFRFFACLFDCTRKELEGNFQIQQSYTRLAQSWRSYLTSRRQDFYASVLRAAKEENTLDLRNEMDNALLRLDQLLKQIDDLSSVKCDPYKVKVMLYFDEAHTLNGDWPVLDNGQDLLDALCLCLAQFYNQPLFTIFLSTNFSLSRLARPGKLSSSARAFNNVSALQAPITETPFDCSPKLLIKPYESTFEDVCQIEFMAQFGRPLFWALLEGNDNRTSDLPAKILKLARSKLLCSENLEMNISELGEIEKSVLLDCRLLFDYEFYSQEARHRQMKMVVENMRLAYSIPQSQEYLQSGYSSEPLLAEAAAQQLAEFRRTTPDVELNILKGVLVDDRMIDSDHRGDLIARFLLMLAYDRAVEAEYREEHPNDLQLSDILYSRGCKLVTFVKELYRSNLVDVVLDSKPDNVKSPKTFQTAFRDARVRFTHFAKLADESGMTTEAMFAAFVRGMAFVVDGPRTLVNLIIPVLLKPEGLCEEVMTCIFVSTKQHLQPGTRNTYKIEAEELNFFPEMERNQFLDDDSDLTIRPYITIAMELGGHIRISSESRIAKDDERNTKYSTQKVEKVFEQDTDIEPDRPGRATNKHPRYSIYAYGCSDVVYTVIERDQRDRCAALLKTMDMLGGYPLGEKARENMRSLKPFWSVGVNSYHWTENNFLRSFKAEDVFEESLEVGEIGDTLSDEDDL